MFMCYINSFWPSEVKWWQRSGLTLAQVMSIDNKTLPEPMLTNYQWHFLVFPWGKFRRNCSTYVCLTSVISYGTTDLDQHSFDIIASCWQAPSPSQWRHNGRNGVSNHQPPDCLLNHLFRRRSNKISKLRVTALCAGIHRWPVNSPHKGPVTRKIVPFDDVIMIL